MCGQTRLTWGWLGACREAEGDAGAEEIQRIIMVSLPIRACGHNFITVCWNLCAWTTTAVSWLRDCPRMHQAEAGEPCTQCVGIILNPPPQAEDGAFVHVQCGSQIGSPPHTFLGMSPPVRSMGVANPLVQDARWQIDAHRASRSNLQVLILLQFFDMLAMHAG